MEEEKEDQNNIILGEEKGAGRVMSYFVFASIFYHDVFVVEQLLNYKLFFVFLKNFVLSMSGCSSSVVVVVLVF